MTKNDLTVLVQSGNIANWQGEDVLHSTNQIVQIDFVGTDGHNYSFEYIEIWNDYEGAGELDYQAWTVYQDNCPIEEEIEDALVVYYLGVYAGITPTNIKITTYEQKPSATE